MTKWISIYTKPPPVNVNVLLYDGYTIDTGALNEDGFYVICCACLQGSYAYPTHWAKLPKVPKNEPLRLCNGIVPPAHELEVNYIRLENFYDVFDANGKIKVKNEMA